MDGRDANQLKCMSHAKIPIRLLSENWESKEDRSYIAHRHEDGTFEILGSLVACPPEITPIRSLVMKTDEQQVEDVIGDMCNKDHTVGMKHMSDDCVFVRPSGNPLTKLVGML